MSTRHPGRKCPFCGAFEHCEPTCYVRPGNEAEIRHDLAEHRRLYEEQEQRATTPAAHNKGTTMDQLKEAQDRYFEIANRAEMAMKVLAEAREDLTEHAQRVRDIVADGATAEAVKRGLLRACDEMETAFVVMSGET